MSNWSIWGYEAHLVLVDKNGAFEVLDPVKAWNGPMTEVTLDSSKVLHAISQREQNVPPPLYRAVKFDVS